MIRDMFSVFDFGSKVFCTPFFSENISTAVRAFRHAANDPQSEISKYPSDFALYHFGTFDDTKCEITTITPVQLAVAISFVLPREEIKDDV